MDNFFFDSLNLGFLCLNNVTWYHFFRYGPFRAAMKAANMDAVFNYLFTGEGENLLKKNPIDLNEDGTMKKGVNTDRSKPLFYFADVCAGPGGFSEYVLWRKGFYNAKGFGFTLKGNLILCN